MSSSSKKKQKLKLKYKCSVNNHHLRKPQLSECGGQVLDLKSVAVAEECRKMQGTQKMLNFKTYQTKTKDLQKLQINKKTEEIWSKTRHYMKHAQCPTEGGEKTKGLYGQRLMNRVETPGQNREQVKMGGAGAEEQVNELYQGNHKEATTKIEHIGNENKLYKK